MSEFVKGMQVKVQPTQYGEIIKLGVKMEEFQQNPVNERGYVNIDILTSKEGKKYAKINDYKKSDADAQADVDDEIPF